MRQTVVGNVFISGILVGGNFGGYTSPYDHPTSPIGVW
jgi:hypothetical protein